jgi:hypothetical protein
MRGLARPPAKPSPDSRPRSPESSLSVGGMRSRYLFLFYLLLKIRLRLHFSPLCLFIPLFGHWQKHNSNLLLASSAQSFRFWSPVETHGYIFVILRPFMCFKNGASSSTRGGGLITIDRCRLRFVHSRHRFGKVSGSNLGSGSSIYSVVR